MRKQVKFIIQLGKTVMDDDRAIAQDIAIALTDYGFKDVQVLGIVGERKPDEAFTEVTEEAKDKIEKGFGPEVVE